MVKAYGWQALFDKNATNELQVIGHWGCGDAPHPFVALYHYRVEYFGPLWEKWFNSEGEEGEEPPADVKRLRAILVDPGLGQQVLTEKERDELRKEVMKLWADNMWMINTVGLAYNYNYVKNDLRNIVEGPEFLTLSMQGALPCQWFWKK